MLTKTCVECGELFRTIDDNIVYCSNCVIIYDEFDVEQTFECGDCGAQFSDELESCPDCGSEAICEIEPFIGDDHLLKMHWKTVYTPFKETINDSI